MPMMRSESRTEETSGFVTMIASSAKRMASIAPRSIPAGLSQSTQSKLLRNSSMMRPTPSSVSASLSLVCDAGSRHRFSIRLSRIKACGSLATPCTTLIRSNTTRRSAPITRSRFRRPTSKSITTTFCPACASAAPIAAVDVVLPTPPLPDVTTSTFAISYLLLQLPMNSIERRNPHDLAIQAGLRRLGTQARVQFLRGLVVAVDRNEFGFDLLAVDARGRVAVDARHRAPAQRAIDMDRAAGNDLGARADRAQYRHVALGEDHRLPGPHGTVEQQRRLLRLRLALWRLGFRRLEHAGAATAQQRWHACVDVSEVDAFQAKHADIALLDAFDEMGDRGLAEIDRGEIEHDGLANKEVWRTRQRCIDFFKPTHDGHSGRKHKSDIGASA